MRRLNTFVAAACGAALLISTAASASSRRPSEGSQVVVPHGQAVQIAFAGDTTSFASVFDANALEAVRLAIVAHPEVDGFPIHVNVVEAPCADPAGDVAAAQSIVTNPQNVGVLGQFCSGGFGQALAVYQAAGVVVISGSATDDSLPPFGPTVFNRTIVANGDGGDAWFAQLPTLARDAAWRSAFADLFGSPPTDFADLYYDATSVLLRSLRHTASVDRNGNLVVDRAALARDVRRTKDVHGVTCTITIDPATGNRVNDAKSLARCAG
jgi:ABC-type branched-subunit amino acid transport system substrate-binding protein